MRSLNQPLFVSRRRCPARPRTRRPSPARSRGTRAGPRTRPRGSTSRQPFASQRLAVARRRPGGCRARSRTSSGTARGQLDHLAELVHLQPVACGRRARRARRRRASAPTVVKRRGVAVRRRGQSSSTTGGGTGRQSMPPVGMSQPGRADVLADREVGVVPVDAGPGARRACQNWVKPGSRST